MGSIKDLVERLVAESSNEVKQVFSQIEPIILGLSVEDMSRLSIIMDIEWQAVKQEREQAKLEKTEG